MSEVKEGYPKVQVQHLRYTVEITVNEMLKVLDKDKKRFGTEATLYDQLYNLRTIIAIEYNGMFGPYIFLDIDKEDDTNKNWKEILEIITRYVK